MHGVAEVAQSSEGEFVGLVDVLAANPNGCELLIELLREDHQLYDQRGTATVVRMRGWVLLALSRSVLSDSALLFVLEELDTGGDPYLVAAAARALRSYPKANSTFAPFVMRALNNIRYHDEPVSFDGYGEYAVSSASTSAVRELLMTLAWLGRHAVKVLPDLETLRTPPPNGISKRLLIDLDKAISSIRGDQIDHSGTACCALPSELRNRLSWMTALRRSCGSIGQTNFEDHDGTSITYAEFFIGKPSIVAFFYTRCDNPLKCSLTVTKLAHVQRLLEQRGVAEHVRTAAITYDPGFDLPERLRRYARSRGLTLNAGNRMLRATKGMDALRKHFQLGVNFVGSLINRHRIELYVLDAEGRIATSFERLHWEEEDVVDHAVELLAEMSANAVVEDSPHSSKLPASNTTPMFGTLAALGVAFFTNSPFWWATYKSLLGVGALQRIPYSPWLQPLLAALMLVNLGSTWLRGRATASMSGFYLVSIGALMILLAKVRPQSDDVAIWGVLFTFIGSLLSALSGPRRPLDSVKDATSAIMRIE
jgi:protein SCO1/2